MTKTPTDFDRYGWKCNEDNLKTLPDDAPQAARDLAQWLTLEGRRSSLAEWLGQVKEDGKLHGKFWHLGAWTHRKSHSKPNSANIPSLFHGEPTTAVEEVKFKYDAKLRELFEASPDYPYLVGTDAEGIQLRILAHYMKSKDYVDAICEGNSADETDIHNVNKRALGEVCRDRDVAKTFIYAWLLGAGIPKVASILSCHIGQATTAISDFLTALPELKKVKAITIPRDARRGYFIGLDGRKVICDSEHKMLAGYLQNGESVVMKHATVLWMKWADEERLVYRLVNDVHDEWQTEVASYAHAERIGQLQCKALEQVGKDLGVFCPLAGKSTIGKNWKETH